MIKTLAEMNERLSASSAATYVWNGYTMRREYRIGRVGRARSGKKTHLLMVDVVESAPVGARLRVNAIFAASAPCNGNGQHIGAPDFETRDTDAINCEHCRAAITINE